MKNRLVLALTLSIATTCFCQTTKKVLIIGIDGCRPDALHQANTPNIDALIANGIFSPDALNDDITISGPGWSANLCGVWSNKHLVTGNNFSGNNYDEYPHIFKYIEAFNPELHTVSICHWGPINDFITLDHADFKLNESSDAEVASQTASYLTVNDPDILFIHLDDPDHAGHTQGFSPEVPEYIQAIEDVDGHIGTVLQSIYGRPSFSTEDWLVLVTTDHGGTGFSHGGTSLEEENVFFIASGNTISTEVIRKDSMIISDAPENCLGDSVELRFDGVDDFVQVAPNALFDFGADQDFTIECRVRTDQPGDVAIVGNKDWDSGLNTGFVFSFKYPSGPEWKVNIGDGNNRADINTGSLIADNEWHTLSVSFDRDGFMVLYEDGLAVDSANIAAIGNINTGQGLFFGADINGAYDYKGAIAEIRVWDTVLHGSTISQWHCTRLDNNHLNANNLIGYWQANEGIGQSQITDFSGNNNIGTIVEASWQIPDSIVVYDYSATPRLVDIPATALAHLCVPIQESWGLDGQSLIEACLMTNTSEAALSNSAGFRLSPNPAQDRIEIELENYNLSKTYQIKVWQPDGKLVFETNRQGKTTTLDVSAMPNGVYLIEVIQENKSWTKKLVLPTF